MRTKIDDLIENFRWIAGGDGTEEVQWSEEDPEGEGEGDKSEVAVADEEQPEPVEEVQPEDEGSIPRGRWNDLYGKHQSLKSEVGRYSELGDVGSIQEKLGRLKTYDEQVKSYREQQSLSEDQKAINQSNLDIRSQMESVYPELKNLSRISELDDIKQYRADQILDQASSHLGAILKSNGADVDKTTQGDIEDFLMSKMSSKERDAVTAGDFNVINEVLDRVKGSRLLSSLIVGGQDKTPVSSEDQTPTQKAPMRHKAGGQGAKKKSSKPMTMEEAGRVAWERLKNS